MNTSDKHSESEQERPVLNIVGEKVAFGPLRKDLLPLYQRWINDFDALHKLGDYTPKTLENETKWYEEWSTSEKIISFTIYALPETIPIGTTSLMDINYRTRTAEFGIFIGESGYRGNGCGTETTRLMIDYVFSSANLHNVMLTVFEFNAAGARTQISISKRKPYLILQDGWPDISRFETGYPMKRSRVRRSALAMLFVVVAFAIALNWTWLDAQVRAVVVLSSVLRTPVLDPGLKLLSGDPRTENHPVAGNPAYIVRPEGSGPWPAIFFVNGANPEGRKLPEVRRLAKGLARAGYLVVVADLPGLRKGEITDETRSETIQVARKVANRPDARGGKVGLVGVSTGATLALLAAESKDLKGRVSAVAGIAPYSNIRDVLDIATTGHYRENGKLVSYKANSYLAYVVAHSLIFALPYGKGREELLSAFGKVSGSDPHPLAMFRERRFRDLGPQARGVLRLLANRNPRRFDALYAALPARTRAGLDLLSPLSTAEKINAPVELASGPHDKFFPLSESYAVAKISPDLRVTVTGTLHHAEPFFSIRDLGSFYRFDGFVVRSLRDVREDV